MEKNKNQSKKILEIELKSDLCVGSGYSYAQIVDTDICYDWNGIPYIPGRRIKDCLKEAAELIRIDEETIKAWFGKTGDNETKGLMVDNAYPEGYAELTEEIERIRREYPFYAHYVNPQKVLDYFSDIRSQTSIEKETGKAKKETLRFTRVASHVLPENKTLKFEALIENVTDKEGLEDAAKALRHLGMNRNRGLGNIRCSLKDYAEQRELNTIRDSLNEYNNDFDCIEYVFINTQPLMLSGENANVSETFVRGSSVLGYLAGRYLSQPGKTAADEDFKNLFLNGNVKFDNAIITDTTYRDYVPAPLFLRRLKKTKKHINICCIEDTMEVLDSDQYKTDDGNMPKKESGYINLIDGKLSKLNPYKEIIYHHSMEQDTLYTQEVISPGQRFKGYIKGSTEQLNIIIELLNGCEGVLRFGRSKSAQYGKCQIIRCNLRKSTTGVSFNAGEKVLVSLQSEGIFFNNEDEKGFQPGYITDLSFIRKNICDRLGIKANEAETEESFLEKCTINGYSAVWNLKKASIPAIKAGSTFVFTASEDFEINNEYVGEKNAEGFGKVKIRKLSSMKRCIPDMENKINSVDDQKPLSVKKGTIIFDILEYNILKDLRELLRDKAIQKHQINISASLLGRVTLMLQESVRNNRDNYKNALIDFYKRINSIKSENKENIISFLTEKLGRCISEGIVDLETMLSGSGTDILEKHIKELFDTEEEESKIKALWKVYIMDVLVMAKYEKGKEKSQNEQ